MRRIAVAMGSACAALVAMTSAAWADAYVGAQPPQVQGLTTGAPRVAATHVLAQQFSRGGGASGPSWLAFTGMSVAAIVAIAVLAMVIGGRLRQAGRTPSV